MWIRPLFTHRDPGLEIQVPALQRRWNSFVWKNLPNRNLVCVSFTRDYFLPNRIHPSKSSPCLHKFTIFVVWYNGSWVTNQWTTVHIKKIRFVIKILNTAAMHVFPYPDSYLSCFGDRLPVSLDFAVKSRIRILLKLCSNMQVLSRNLSEICQCHLVLYLHP